MLSQNAPAFFAFANACRARDPDDAAAQHLGATLEDIVIRALSRPI